MLARNLSTPENRAFWNHVEETAIRVRTWPKWMWTDSGGAINSHSDHQDWEMANRVNSSGSYYNRKQNRQEYWLVLERGRRSPLKVLQSTWDYPSRPDPRLDYYETQDCMKWQEDCAANEHGVRAALLGLLDWTVMLSPLRTVVNPGPDWRRTIC